MYGNNHSVGCLNVSTYTPTEPIRVMCSDIAPDIHVAARKIGKELDVCCSIVCSINNQFFIEVEQVAVWLTHEMLSSAEFNVKSNVNWIIE